MNAPLAQDIYEPKSLTDAGALLKERREKAALIAGGTDLIIKLKEGVAQPEVLIDIMKLPLDHIKGSRIKGIHLGATITAEQVCKSALLQKELSVLSAAALHLGGPQTQAMATVGGNLCNASPCANFTNVLVALEAQIKIYSADGERTVPIDDFFRGPGVTVLKPTEMITEIIIPGFAGSYGASYVKHTLRREMDIAIVGVVALLIREGKTMKRVRIALGSVGATVIRATNAQHVLEGMSFEPSRIATAAKLAAEKDASYIDDVRASAAYRAVITEYAVKKAITEAWVMGGEK